MPPRNAIFLGLILVFVFFSIATERRHFQEIFDYTANDNTKLNDKNNLKILKRHFVLNFSEFHFKRINASSPNITTKSVSELRSNGTSAFSTRNTATASRENDEPDKSSTNDNLEFNSSTNQTFYPNKNKNETTISNDSSIIMTWSRENYQSLPKDGAEEEPNMSVRLVDGLLGTIKGGRLVVDINHTHMFWNNGQTRLCNILKNMTMSTQFDDNDDDRHVPLLLNATMDCKEQVKHEGFGQGNWVTALYCARIAAARAKVDFQFQCSDGRKSQGNLLLPWFAGFQVAPNASSPWPYTGSLPTVQQACTASYPQIRVDKIADQIIDTVRKMAVELVGARDDIRRHDSVPLNAIPLVTNVTLDDVAIHFRCGDVMGGARRSDFGMIKFTEYKKWISKDAKSIGILTQPFDAARNRKLDRGKVESCRKATYLLVDTLQDFLPAARITIHNGVNETLPLAYGKWD